MAERISLVNGNRFGVYVIESQLGSGGMVEVYRARDEQLQPTVAIKMLLRTQTAEGDRRARFLQEARAASALNHPNIVTIYGVGTEEAVTTWRWSIFRGIHGCADSAWRAAAQCSRQMRSADRRGNVRGS